MPKKWKTLGTKQIFGNRIFGFREDTVKSPKTDNTHPVWVMDAPTWVNIIPITKEKKVIMIKQYRFGSQEISLEIPGGMVDAGEDTQSFLHYKQRKNKCGLTLRQDWEKFCQLRVLPLNRNRFLPSFHV